MHRSILMLLFLFASSANASSIADLEKRNSESVAEANGSEFEMQAVRDFWGDPHFMMQCLPPGSPIHEPFTIYFEVLPSGKIGELAFTTNTKVTRCIEENVRKKNYDKPKKPFVAKIDLKFTE